MRKYENTGLFSILYGSSHKRRFTCMYAVVSYGTWNGNGNRYMWNFAGSRLFTFVIFFHSAGWDLERD